MKTVTYEQFLTFMPCWLEDGRAAWAAARAAACDNERVWQEAELLSMLREEGWDGE